MESPSQTLDRLTQEVRDLQDQLVKEAARTAEQKLRADQITQQHAMQAKMHALAMKQLACIKTIEGYDAGMADFLVALSQVESAQSAQAAPQAVQPVASIYITEGGAREFDDWKVPLPVGSNELYTHPTQQGLDAQKEARNTGINHGVCLALQIMTAAGDAGSAQWDELVDTAGRAELEHYAKFVEPEEWELGGFAQVERAKQENADTDAAIAAQAKQGGV